MWVHVLLVYTGYSSSRQAVSRWWSPLRNVCASPCLWELWHWWRHERLRRSSLVWWCRFMVCACCIQSRSTSGSGKTRTLKGSHNCFLSTTKFYSVHNVLYWQRRRKHDLNDCDPLCHVCCCQHHHRHCCRSAAEAGNCRKTRLRQQLSNFHQTPARWRSSLRCSSSFLWSTSPRLQTDGARIPSHPQIRQHFLDFPPDLLGAGRGEQFCQLLTCLRSSRFRQELCCCLLLRCKVQCVTAESAMRHDDQSEQGDTEQNFRTFRWCALMTLWR